MTDSILTPEKILAMKKEFEALSPLRPEMRFIKLPATVTRQRSWKERLFSWPWRPWMAQERIPNQALPPEGMTLFDKSRNVFYLRPDDYERLSANPEKWRFPPAMIPIQTRPIFDPERFFT